MKSVIAANTERRRNSPVSQSRWPYLMDRRSLLHEKLKSLGDLGRRILVFGRLRHAGRPVVTGCHWAISDSVALQIICSGAHVAERAMLRDEPVSIKRQGVVPPTSTVPRWNRRERLFALRVLYICIHLLPPTNRLEASPPQGERPARSRAIRLATELDQHQKNERNMSRNGARNQRRGGLEMIRKRDLRPRRIRPTVMALEDRMLMCTFVVTNNADSGPGSIALRDQSGKFVCRGQQHRV